MKEICHFWYSSQQQLRQISPKQMIGGVDYKSSIEIDGCRVEYTEMRSDGIKETCGTFDDYVYLGSMSMEKFQKVRRWEKRPAKEENKVSEYVKIKKDDLLKTHKDSCGDVKRVLEGLYPREFRAAIVPVGRLRARVVNQLATEPNSFCVQILIDSTVIGTLHRVRMPMTERGYKLRNLPGWDTYSVIETE